jgi:hypothetical protein
MSAIPRPISGRMTTSDHRIGGHTNEIPATVATTPAEITRKRMRIA